MLIALGLGAIGVSLKSFAQQPGRIWRIGLLQTSSDPRIRSDLVRYMHELGYVEGKNLVIEFQTAEGELKRLPALAEALVQLKVDAILTSGTPSTVAAQKATPAIPVVMMNVADPVASGIVKELARPGGNVTGVSDLTGDLGPKNLEILLEIIPGLRRIGLLVDPTDSASTVIGDGVRTASRKVGVTTVPILATTQADLYAAFPKMRQEKTSALMVVGGNFFTQHIGLIAALAMKHQVVLASTNPGHPPAGALVSYAANRSHVRQRAVYYLDRILKGATPGDLPVEQPTKFELLINMKTAKALGLIIPQSVLARADTVIE